jgi:hypothetical protein
MPFWQELLLQIVGPLIGALGIGVFATWITRKAQDRRRASQLRGDLISQMTRAASRLYFSLKEYSERKTLENVDDSELARLRSELDKQYQETRVDGEVLERRLDAYFVSKEPSRLWHATMDLLRARYWQVIGRPENWQSSNAGREHSGLTIEELKDIGLVLKTYQEKLRAATRAVLDEQLLG